MPEFRPGDKVVSGKLGPGVWTVTAAYTHTVAVTLNRVTHVRPNEGFTFATPADVRKSLLDKS